jgi:hypothetical protein
MGKKNKNKNKNRNNNRNQNNGQNNQQSFNNNPVNDYPSDNNVYDAEKIDQAGSPKKNIITLVVVVFLAMLLTVLILLTTGLLKKDNISFLNFANNSVATESIFDDTVPQDSKFADGINSIPGKASRETNGLAMFSRVKLPMLLGDYYKLDLELEKAGCDRIYWVTRYVEPTPAPLNATYNELFSYDEELDFYVGNFAAKQTDLNFDYAEIENRVAKVYLTGSTTESVGECPDRLRVQLTQAALQFNTISSVEIYLNGELY